MNAFALRSSDNALVWVKDAPHKPTSEYLPDSPLWNAILDQAIADGVRVADKDKPTILKYIWGLPEVGLTTNKYVNLKHDHLYHLDVEMEMIIEYRKINPREWEPKGWLTWTSDSEIEKNPNFEYRQLAYLKPKTENDMKEKCRRYKDEGILCQDQCYFKGSALKECEPKTENDMKEKCTGSKYCDCAKEAIDGGASRDWVEGLEVECKFKPQPNPKQDREEVYGKEEKLLLIRELKDGVRRCKKNMDVRSWGYEEGVLISGNDAKYILSQLTQSGTTQNRK